MSGKGTIPPAVKTERRAAEQAVAPDGLLRGPTGERHVERYKQARMRGECATGNQVGPRTVAADLVALMTMLNWATRKRDG